MRAAKSGLVGLTRTPRARMRAARASASNAVLPGYTRTRLVEEWLSTQPDPAAAERRVLARIRSAGWPRPPKSPTWSRSSRPTRRRRSPAHRSRPTAGSASCPGEQTDDPMRITDVRTTVVGTPWRELVFLELVDRTRGWSASSEVRMVNRTEHARRLHRRAGAAIRDRHRPVRRRAPGVERPARRIRPARRSRAVGARVASTSPAGI